jgi:hypothetical protein
MPVTYVIDAATHLIRTVCARPLTFAEVLDHFRQLNEDSACTGHLDVLLDLTDADSVPETIQLGAVGAAVNALRKKVTFRACGIVAVTDVMFGMMRVFEVKAEGYFQAIRVFRKISDAEAWLLLQKSPPAAES